MLYLRLMEEKVEGGIIHMVEANRCAVFSDHDLNELISQTATRLRQLKKLKKDARTHSIVISDAYLRDLRVPYTIKKFIQKKC